MSWALVAWGCQDLLPPLSRSFKHRTCGPANIKITLSNSMFMYYRFSDLSLPGQAGKCLVLWTLTRKAPWSFSSHAFLTVSLSGKKTFHPSLHLHTLLHHAMLHQAAASTLHLLPTVNKAVSGNEQLQEIICLSSAVKEWLQWHPCPTTPLFLCDEAQGERWA